MSTIDEAVAAALDEVRELLDQWCADSQQRFEAAMTAARGDLVTHPAFVAELDAHWERLMGRRRDILVRAEGKLRAAAAPYATATLARALH